MKYYLSLFVTMLTLGASAVQATPPYQEPVKATPPHHEPFKDNILANTEADDENSPEEE